MTRLAVGSIAQIGCSEKTLPSGRRPYRSLNELHEATLEHFKVMWHQELGVLAAAHYCAENDLMLPQWVIRRIPSVVASLLNGRTRKRGRACNPFARYRQDMIDHDRWSAVKEVREKQTEIFDRMTQLRVLSKVPSELMEETEKMLAWVGDNLEQAYRCAAMLLCGTDAFAGPDAMKQSYLRVEKRSRDSQQALRYHLLDSRFLRTIGIDINFSRPRVRKIVPLYDLTLD